MLTGEWRTVFAETIDPAKFHGWSEVRRGVERSAAALEFCAVVWVNHDVDELVCLLRAEELERMQECVRGMNHALDAL